MKPIATLEALQPLVGLRLSIARSAADMRIFHFGDIKPHSGGKGTVGAYALHVQCPWRLVDADGLITGTSDFYTPAQEGADVDRSDPKAGSLQDMRLGEILGEYDPDTRSHTNITGGLLVTAIATDQYGGLEIALSGNLRLQLFPDGSLEENWRFLETSGRGMHFVIEGGREMS